MKYRSVSSELWDQVVSELAAMISLYDAGMKSSTIILEAKATLKRAKAIDEAPTEHEPAKLGLSEVLRRIGNNAEARLWNSASDDISDIEAFRQIRDECKAALKP